MIRKEMTDILTSLMGDGNKTIKQENHKEINTVNHKEINTVSNKEIKQESNITRKQYSNKAIGKEKATFNLNKKVLKNLEKCWIQIRDIRGDKKISKTHLVEFALTQTLEQFRTGKKDESIFNFIENME
jgi:hypothetical protein